MTDLELQQRAADEVRADTQALNDTIRRAATLGLVITLEKHPATFWGGTSDIVSALIHSRDARFEVKVGGRFRWMDLHVARGKIRDAEAGLTAHAATACDESTEAV